ncbi:MAG: glycosyltransferase family 2 protein [Pedobacter sp.]|nr:MAG: glycosyltransferase family 2 protein [Pedobacter sp.]
MKFSILVANFNSAQYFADCYKSIVDQTYKDFEVIIVDDRSTDNSVEVIKSMIAGDDRFRLFFNEVNKGCGFTKWHCAEHATGEICGFLDPDDTLEPLALQVMIDEFRDNNDISIVFSRHNRCDSNLLPLTQSPIRRIPSGMSYLTFAQHAPEHFTAFRRLSYLSTDRLNKKFLRAIDQDLNFKLEEAGKLRIIDTITYNYRVHNNSLSNAGDYKALFWNMLAINDACERRGISSEVIANKVLQMHIEARVEHFRNLYYGVVNRKAYRIMMTAISPFLSVYRKLRK